MRARAVVCLAFALVGCAAMHKQTVANMRANGDPRADCYEACSPSDAVCMKECDNKHPLAGTMLQGAGGGSGAAPAPASSSESGATIDPDRAAAVAKVVGEAVLADEAKRRERNAQSTDTSTSSPPPSSAGSGIAVTHTKKETPRSDSDCHPACGPGKRCMVFLAGSKQCAPGPHCWIVEKTHGECR